MVKKLIVVLTAILLVLCPSYFLSFDVNAASATVQVTIYAFEDAYVNASSSGTNYGGATTLYVGANTELDFTYLKFDLSSIPLGANILSANLSLYLLDTGGDIFWSPADLIGAYYCSDNSWSELEITWDNMPTFNPAATDSWYFNLITYLNEYKSWTITADVNAALLSRNLTEVLKFWTKTGDGYAVYQSREETYGPKLEIEYATAPSLSSFEGQFATNIVKVTYPSDSAQKPLGCAAAWVSDWMASAFVTTKLQSHTEGLDTNSNFVDQTTGRPQGTPGQGIISFGGPVVNPIVKYVESSSTATADRAPIRFYTEGDVFYFQHWDGSSITNASLPASAINNDQDMFVIEIYLDASGRYVMLCYGFGWKGTYAAGKYFHTTIYPDLASYDINWIVVKWQDSNGDGFVNNPDDGDTYTVIASSST